MALPSRVDSGVIYSQAGPVHRDGGEGQTICREAIPAKHRKISDNQIRVGRLSKCPQCWWGRGGSK